MICMPLRTLLAAFLVVATTGPVGWADVRLPKLFTDNMMLQRDKPVRVWGWAEPGEDVNVTLAALKDATKADDKGEW